VTHRVTRSQVFNTYRLGINIHNVRHATKNAITRTHNKFKFTFLFPSDNLLHWQCNTCILWKYTIHFGLYGTVKVNRQLISQALLSNRTDIHRMAAIHCYSTSISFLVPDNSITTLTFVVPRQFLQLYPSVSTIDCTVGRSMNYQTHHYSQSCFNIL